MKRKYQWRWIKSCAPKPRFFKIKSLITGKTEECYNIRQWCRDNNLPKDSSFSISLLLSGKLKRYKQYVLPENKVSGYQIKDLRSGIIYRHYLKRELCKILGINLERLNHILLSNKNRFKSFALPNFNNFEAIPIVFNDNTDKTYIVYENWTRFCNKHHLHQSLLRYKGKYKEWQWINKSLD